MAVSDPSRRSALAGPARRWLLVAAGVVAILLIAAFAVDSSRSDTIAKGVKVGGIDVGGMSTAKARAVLAARLAPVVDRPAVAQFRGRRFVLTAQQAGVRPDIDGSVNAALARSRGGWFVGRAIDAVTGATVNADIVPQVTYSELEVGNFVTHVAHSLDRAPADATVTFSGSGPHEVPAKDGVTVDQDALRNSLDAALAGSGSRTVAVNARTQPASVTLADLPSRYPAAIVVDRAAFSLRLYKNLKLAATYPIAVGMQGLETPAGLYHVQSKQVDPSWFVPNSAWAGSLAGHVIPPGPQDPLKARWIGFDGSAGIHGTDDTGSIGSNASHGCIRMLIPDVIALFPQVKVGDPVYIA